MGALLLLDGEVRPGDVADEQGVPGQYRPRLGAPRGIDEGERGVLGAVARRMECPDAEVAKLEFPPVIERFVLVLSCARAMDADGGARRRGEAAVAGDVIGMRVGLEDVLDRDTHVACEAQVLGDVELGIDDRRHAGPFVADQVARAAKVVVSDLAKDHA